MKKTFNHYAIQFVAALAGGLLLLLLHGVAKSGLPAVFVPQFPSGWELSKLLFWPLLLVGLLSSRWEKQPLVRYLPAAVLAPLLQALLNWGVLAAGGNGAICLVLWVAVLAAALAFAPGCGRHPVLWAVLALALAGLYILLTFTPPVWGPFWNPLG